MGAILVGLAAAGLRALDARLQEGARAMERDLGRALELEEAAWLARSVELYQETLDPDADPAWRAGEISHFEARAASASQPRRLRGIEIRPVAGALAVQVEVDPAGPLPRLVERRFYRTEAVRWLRTAPRQAFWGPGQVSRSEHFVLRYRRLDAPLVRSLLEDLESLREQLRSDLGVTGPPESVGILLAAPGEATEETREGMIVVNSPLIVAAQAPDEGIKWTLGYAVTGRMLAQVVGPEGDVGPWFTLVQATADWEVQQWLWGGLTAELTAQETEAARYAVLHGTLETMRDIKPRFERFALPHVLMVDHVASAYGRSSLGSLVRAMSREPTWAGLVKEGLGVPLDEFSASWERYRDGWRRSP